MYGSRVELSFILLNIEIDVVDVIREDVICLCIRGYIRLFINSYHG